MVSSTWAVNARCASSVSKPSARSRSVRSMHALADRPDAGRLALGVEPQRAAVGLELLDVEELEPVVGEHALGGQAGEVLEVLVIDRVELVVLDQPQQVRHLDRHHAVVGQQDLEAGDEVVEVRHVRHHVVGGDQVGALALVDEIASRLAAEESDERVDPEILRDLGDVGGGLDAERRDAALDDVLQQVAVVAGDLHHEAVPVEAEALDRHLDVAARVLDPGVRVRGEVGVLREDVLAGHELLELHEQAALADLRVQRVERPPSR